MAEHDAANPRAAPHVDGAPGARAQAAHGPRKAVAVGPEKYGISCQGRERRMDEKQVPQEATRHGARQLPSASARQAPAARITSNKPGGNISAEKLRFQPNTSRSVRARSLPGRRFT